MLSSQFSKDGARVIASIVTMIAVAWCETLCFAATPATNYKPPRAEDGKPDLQGIWTNSSVTGLERPGDIHKLVLTEAEAQAWVGRSELVEHVTTDHQAINPKTGLLDGSDLAAGHGYNGF